MGGSATLRAGDLAISANDRLKHGFGESFWKSLVLAALLHLLVLALWPQMGTTDVSFSSEEMQQLEVMPEVEIPPPPEDIARPAIPILSMDVTLSDDITIESTTFADNPVSELPPPPVGQADLSENPVFVPRDVEPVFRNREEFGRLLAQQYPPMLRDAGIGGTVVLWVWVEANGAVGQTRVISSSTNEVLDSLAQQVMRESARFSPALNRDQKVAVWIQMPVTFRTR